MAGLNERGDFEGQLRCLSINDSLSRKYQENQNIKKSSFDELKSSGLASAPHEFLFLYCVVFLWIGYSPLSFFFARYLPHHSVRRHRSIRKHFRLYVVLFADQIIFFDCHFLVFLRSSSCSKYQLRKVIKISAGWFFYRHEIRETEKRARECLSRLWFHLTLEQFRGIVGDVRKLWW